MRAGTKRRFNPGEIVECTDEFRGDDTIWSREPFGVWALRNGVPTAKLQSRRSELGHPRIMLRLSRFIRYSDSTGPKHLYGTGLLCAIRIPVPSRQVGGRRDMLDTHLYFRK